MPQKPFRQVGRINRRAFLRRLTAGIGGAAAAGALAPTAGAQDDLITRSIGRPNGGNGPDGGRGSYLTRAASPTLSPLTVQNTELAIRDHEGIVARGGWPAVALPEGLRPGSRHSGVVALRRRLIASGDLEQGASAGDRYDAYVETALQRFQARHGYNADGVLRQQTIAALNIPADLRLSQLRTNAIRLRSMSGDLGARFVCCNLPAAQIEAVADGLVASRHAAVVGKPDRPSPDINSRIVEVNFNPFWTVPFSIVKRDLIPKMQAQPDYLEKNRIRIYDMRGHELTPSMINWYSNEAVNYMFKQDPGEFNSLGSIRINFPSKDSVYMHDTPLKNLFGDDMRFHSSGCVRVQSVRELVDWLLRETPGWPPAEIDAVIRSGERKNARLARPVPVYWVYVTAWAAPDGTVQFRDDIYNRDGLGPYATSFKG